jgi:5-methylcytosine-specific restriction endonuclease McrA
MSLDVKQGQNMTLVLNSSYQPITTIDPKRAAVLLIDGVAELVEGTGRFFRSPSISVPVASVVRLCRQTRTPRKYKVHLTKRTLFARDSGLCAYCLSPAENIDHVIPKSRPGGTHVWTNVVAACQRCNVKKGARTPEEAGMKLRKQPTEPRGQEAFILGLAGYQDSWGMWFNKQS